MAHTNLRWQRDKHINQGATSLLPILSHSLPLKNRKHVEIVFNCSTKAGAYGGGEGEQGGQGVPTTSDFMGGGEDPSSVSGKWSPSLLSEFPSDLSYPLARYWGRMEKEWAQGREGSWVLPLAKSRNKGLYLCGMGQDTQNQSLAPGEGVDYEASRKWPSWFLPITGRPAPENGGLGPCGCRVVWKKVKARGS